MVQYVIKPIPKGQYHKVCNKHQPICGNFYLVSMLVIRVYPNIYRQPDKISFMQFMTACGVQIQIIETKEDLVYITICDLTAASEKYLNKVRTAEVTTVQNDLNYKTV